MTLIYLYAANNNATRMPNPSAAIFPFQKPSVNLCSMIYSRNFVRHTLL